MIGGRELELHVRGGGIVALIKRDIAHSGYVLLSEEKIQVGGVTINCGDGVHAHLVNIYIANDFRREQNIFGGIYRLIPDRGVHDFVIYAGDLNCHENCNHKCGLGKWKNLTYFKQVHKTITVSANNTTFYGKKLTSSPDHTILIRPEREKPQFCYDDLFGDLLTSWRTGKKSLLVTTMG